MFATDCPAGADAPGRPAPAPAPVRLAPAHFLTLPVLHPEVPGAIEIIEGPESEGMLAPWALALAAEGILTAEILDRDKRGHLLPPCSTAFQEWVARETARLKFSVSACFTDNWETHFDDLVGDFSVRDGETGMEKLQKKRGALALLMNTDTSDWCLAGPRLIALEAEHPGLGHTVLHILEEAMDSTIGVFGPSRALGAVQMIHWQGETDHRMRLEELEYEEGRDDLADIEIEPGHGPVTLVMRWTYDDKEFCEGEVTWDIPPDVTLLQLRAFDYGACELLTDEDFYAALPQWACHCRAKKLGVRQLRRLTQTLRPCLALPVGLAADLADAIAADPPGGDHDMFYAIGESLYPLLLGWTNQHDMVARMHDDMARGTMESGEGTAVRWITLFDPASEKAGRAAIRRLRSCFAILRRCHLLIEALTTKR